MGIACAETGVACPAAYACVAQVVLTYDWQGKFRLLRRSSKSVKYTLPGSDGGGPRQRSAVDDLLTVDRSAPPPSPHRKRRERERDGGEAVYGRGNLLVASRRRGREFVRIYKYKTGLTSS